MRPADETPELAPGQRARDLYHIHRNAQVCPPGAPEGPPEKRKARGNIGADLSRLYLLYLSNPTQARLDELMTNCMKFLERRVAYYVRRKGYCPDSLAANTFIDDALSRAHYKFSKAIHALRSPEVLSSWIDRVARSAVVEELYDVIRRTKQSSSRLPLEIEYPDGTVKHVLDKPENRDAAERYRCVTIQQTQFVKQLVYRDILGKLFDAAKTGSERQLMGIKFLKMMLAGDLTAEEIATQHGLTKSEVLSIMRAACKRLRPIAESCFKFSAD